MHFGVRVVLSLQRRNQIGCVERFQDRIELFGCRIVLQLVVCLQEERVRYLVIGQLGDYLLDNSVLVLGDRRVEAEVEAHRRSKEFLLVRRLSLEGFERGSHDCVYLGEDRLESSLSLFALEQPREDHQEFMNLLLKQKHALHLLLVQLNR